MSVNMIAASRRFSDCAALLGSFFMGMDYSAGVAELSTVRAPGRSGASRLLSPSSQVGLLPPSPLGTDRESFPSISSSLTNALLRTRFHHFQLQAMHLSMAYGVKQHKVFCYISAP